MLLPGCSYERELLGQSASDVVAKARLWHTCRVRAPWPVFKETCIQGPGCRAGLGVTHLSQLLSCKARESEALHKAAIYIPAPPLSILQGRGLAWLNTTVSALSEVDAKEIPVQIKQQKMPCHAV